jgi:hypothetical protein
MLQYLARCLPDAWPAAPHSDDLPAGLFRVSRTLSVFTNHNHFYRTSLEIGGLILL